MNRNETLLPLSTSDWHFKTLAKTWTSSVWFDTCLFPTTSNKLCGKCCTPFFLNNASSRPSFTGPFSLRYRTTPGNKLVSPPSWVITSSLSFYKPKQVQFVSFRLHSHTNHMLPSLVKTRGKTNYVTDLCLLIYLPTYLPTYLVSLFSLQIINKYTASTHSIRFTIYRSFCSS